MVGQVKIGKVEIRIKIKSASETISPPILDNCLKKKNIPGNPNFPNLENKKIFLFSHLKMWADSFLFLNNPLIMLSLLGGK